MNADHAVIDRRTVRASVVVAAPPAEVFALLANPHRHHEFDGSGTVGAAVSGPDRLALDDRFGIRMHRGLRYRVTNRVVEFEQDRLIGWCHPARAIWRYELEPVDGGTPAAEPATPPPGAATGDTATGDTATGDTATGRRGTRITETFDFRASPVARVIELVRMHEVNARSIRNTLRRLQEIFGPA